VPEADFGQLNHGAKMVPSEGRTPPARKKQRGFGHGANGRFIVAAVGG
jgi:hypothetical protein